MGIGIWYRNQLLASVGGGKHICIIFGSSSSSIVQYVDVGDRRCSSK